MGGRQAYPAAAAEAKAKAEAELRIFAEARAKAEREAKEIAALGHTAGEAVTEGNENHMVGVLENTLLSGSHIYMLSLFQGQVGFRSLLESSYTLGAGKAYLDANLSTSTTSAMDFMFCSLEGNQTAIDSVTAEQSNVRKSVYSVSGQRLSSPRKGLNIVDGKVVIF